MCKHCDTIQWLPGFLSDALNLSIDMKYYGIEPAYYKWIDARPKLRELLVKLQDIRAARGKLSKRRMLNLIQAIISDHKFEYREQLEKEGVKLKKKGKKVKVEYPED